MLAGCQGANGKAAFGAAVLPVFQGQQHRSAVGLSGYSWLVGWLVGGCNQPTNQRCEYAGCMQFTRENLLLALALATFLLGLVLAMHWFGTHPSTEDLFGCNFVGLALLTAAAL